MGKTFTILLQENEVNALLNILGEKPYNQVAPLIASIFNQAQAQANTLTVPDTPTPG